MNSSYSIQFQKVQLKTDELQNPVRLAYWRSKGYVWIRRDTERSFRQILRNPIMGCWVELFKVPNVGTEYIDSAAGKRLIRRLAW
jgi:hypothetical protein